MSQNIIFANDLKQELSAVSAAKAYDRVFVLCDENTRRHCLPLVGNIGCIAQALPVTITAGDDSKNIDSALHIWRALAANGATRHSLLINIGGGMVCDIGGFAAATFKRGIDFINLPTTLLGMVDAAAGGKTGINLDGLKNEVGCFQTPQKTIISTDFLKTLPPQEMLSGYAEMIKHSLLDNTNHWSKILDTDNLNCESKNLTEMIRLSIDVKSRFADADPHEKGIRKALNLGHTIGHAIETWSHCHGKPMPHGYCVAYGTVGALYISCAETAFPTDRMRQTVRFISEVYSRPSITCNDYDELLQLMSHDKKNIGNDIIFTLLADIGKPEINRHVGEELIREALDFIREG